MGGRGSASRRGGGAAGGPAKKPEEEKKPPAGGGQAGPMDRNASSAEAADHAEANSKASIAASNANQPGIAQRGIDYTITAAERARELAGEARRAAYSAKGTPNARAASRAAQQAEQAETRASNAAGQAMHAYESKYGRYKYNPAGTYKR